jgi:hypothetical protein
MNKCMDPITFYEHFSLIVPIDPISVLWMHFCQTGHVYMSLGDLR